jgi:hypothetical protein
MDYQLEMVAGRCGDFGVYRLDVERVLMDETLRGKLSQVYREEMKAEIEDEPLPYLY